MSFRLTRMAFAVASVLSLGLPAAGSAQEDDPRSAKADAQVTAASESPLWRELGLDAESRRSARASRILAVLSEANLKALVAGEDPANVVTLSGRSLREEIQPDALGSTVDELVYTPLNPCRVIDTRNAGGAFAAGETRNYNLIGPTDYSSIGGEAAGCSIPTTFGGGISSSNTVRGILLNIVGVTAGGPGNFKAWPTNLTEPTAAVLNYNPVQNVANGILLKTCDALCIDFIPPFTCGDPCPSGDLSIKSSNSVHLVVDVVGYLTGASVGASTQVSNSTPISLSSGACTNLTSTGLTNSSNASRGVVCWGMGSFRIEHTLGTQDNLFMNIATATATCASDASAAWLAVDTNMPTTSGTQTDPLFAVGRFSLAANTTQTYYLNANISLGASAADDMVSSRLVCMLEP